MTRKPTTDPEAVFKQLESAFAPCDVVVMRHHPGMIEGFMADSAESFRQGARGAAHDMGLVARPWGFDPAGIRTPVYLWQGEEDQNAPPAAGRYLAQTIPACRAVFCPGEGHMLYLNHWREILAVLN